MSAQATTRKPLLLMMILIAMLGLLAACGDSDDDNGGENGDDAPLILQNITPPSDTPVLPQPNAEAEPIFSAEGDFRPHAGGRTEDGAWLWVFYAEGVDWQAGWIERSQLGDLTSGINDLQVIDPANPPDIPIAALTINQAAQRPGFSAPVPDPTQANY